MNTKILKILNDMKKNKDFYDFKKHSYNYYKNCKFETIKDSYCLITEELLNKELSNTEKEKLVVIRNVLLKLMNEHSLK